MGLFGFGQNGKAGGQILGLASFGFTRVQPTSGQIGRRLSSSGRSLAGEKEVNNPNVKGYLAKVKEQYSHIKDIVFTGYVDHLVYKDAI